MIIVNKYSGLFLIIKYIFNVKKSIYSYNKIGDKYGVKGYSDRSRTWGQ